MESTSVKDGKVIVSQANAGFAPAILNLFTGLGSLDGNYIPTPMQLAP
jgi:hypothetical protein